MRLKRLLKLALLIKRLRGNLYSVDLNGLIPFDSKFKLQNLY